MRTPFGLDHRITRQIAFATALSATAFAATALAGCAEVVIDTSGGGGHTAGTGGTASSGGGGETITETFCQCASDADCPGALSCDGCLCTSPCEPGCGQGYMCCEGGCVYAEYDPDNCGGCGMVCDLPQATAGCDHFTCIVDVCDQGFYDCDGLAFNGCETAGGCNCIAGAVEPCYTGPEGTSGVGACLMGIQECVEGEFWGPCEGQVLPQAETCNGVDDDCDGHGDDFDPDGDGWSACDGDCCESAACADHPEAVNPGAIEYPGNAIDDDCNAATSDMSPYPTCDDLPLQTPTSAFDLARAMDLCNATTEDAPLPNRRWGLISADLALADGSPANFATDVQRGVLASYGLNVAPQYGLTMAALSTGTARDEDDPGFIYPQNGLIAGQAGNFVAGTSCPVPADYLAANGGVLPTPCSPCNSDACKMAFDSVLLKLRIRTPTNMKAFNVDFKFYSAEYPENVCSQYNDFFVALLDSQHPDNPLDHNIALDLVNDPISVNNVLFDVCAIGGACTGGLLELEGTGMGGWDGTLTDGAGTSWTRDMALIVPGETIELRFAIWDAMDGNVDSLVLIDRFRWLLDPPLPPWKD